MRELCWLGSEFGTAAFINEIIALCVLMGRTDDF